MKIAQIAPLIESVPPALYGGTERVVSWLTEELVRQGHDVTLFASGDSKTAAKLVPVVPRALRLEQIGDATPYNFLLLGEVVERAEEFDILHFHVDFIHYPIFMNTPSRILTTLHGRLDLPALQPLYRMFAHMPLASISDSQRAPMPPVNWMGTVYHGLPSAQFKLQPNPEGYLAFLGRISPEKRADRAIEIAKRTGMRLKIAAKVDVVDRDYFRTVIEPLLDDPRIEFVGEISDSQKQEFLGNATALLFPIDWPEPFGLVMIEAMACGTPVVAFRCGSVCEVIDEAVTGFIVDDVAQAAEAVSNVGRLSRQGVRQRFEKRFSASAMAERYLAIYSRLLLAQTKAAQRAA